MLRTKVLSFCFATLVAGAVLLVTSAGCTKPTSTEPETASAPSPKVAPVSAEHSAPLPASSSVAPAKQDGAKSESVAPVSKPAEAKPAESKPAEANGDPTKDIVEHSRKFSALQISLADLMVEEPKTFDTLADPLEVLKKICDSYKLKPVLRYDPLFETTEATFVLKELAAWHWQLCVKRNKDEIRDCIDVNMTGAKPVVTVTKEGRWRLPETMMIPFGTVALSFVDSTKKEIGGEIVFPLLKPEKANASVYFPDGTAPQFLERMFDIKLISSAGQLKIPSATLCVQAQGKTAIRIPILQYYKTKKEEKEKERGAAFGTTSGPSPAGDTIGTVLYWDINENHLGKLGVSDKNDVGYDFYFEDSHKQKITAYEARPQ